MGVILESVIKSVVLKFEGRSKNIANKNINPLDKDVVEEALKITEPLKEDETPESDDENTQNEDS